METTKDLNSDKSSQFSLSSFQPTLVNKELARMIEIGWDEKSGANPALFGSRAVD